MAKKKPRGGPYFVPPGRTPAQKVAAELRQVGGGGPAGDDMTPERLRTLTAHALHGVLGWLISSARLSAEEKRALAALELYLRTAPAPELDRFLALYRDQP